MPPPVPPVEFPVVTNGMFSAGTAAELTAPCMSNLRSKSPRRGPDAALELLAAAAGTSAPLGEV
jgi:hypothetical protein